MTRNLLGFISKNNDSNKLGYTLILISAILAALVHVLAKPLLDNQTGFEIHPITLAACIYMINGAFFTPFTKKSMRISSLGKKNLSLLIIIGISEVIALILYFSGLKESTATNASIFSNGEIVFSLLITMVIFKENLQRRELWPFVMLIIGMMVLPVSYDIYSTGMMMSNVVMGDVLIILSGTFYALDVMLCKYLSDKIDSKRITQMTSLVSAAFAIGAMIAFNIPFDVEPTSLGPIAIFAIGGTGIATMLFLISLRFIGGVRTILIFSTNSVFGVIFAAIILSETITIVNVVSIVLTFVGVYMLRSRLGAKHESAETSMHEALEKPIRTALPSQS
ncbi:MAG: DMT family transporter [Candidatus Nitrosotenuis sp.]